MTERCLFLILQTLLKGLGRNRPFLRGRRVGTLIFFSYGGNFDSPSGCCRLSLSFGGVVGRLSNSPSKEEKTIQKIRCTKEITNKYSRQDRSKFTFLKALFIAIIHVAYSVRGTFRANLYRHDFRFSGYARTRVFLRIWTCYLSFSHTRSHGAGTSMMSHGDVAATKTRVVRTQGTCSRDM